MNFFSGLSSRLADARFAANLIVFYGLVVVTFVGSLMLRRFLSRGGSHLVSWTGFHWLGKVGDVAAHRARKVLFWVTLIALAGITGLGFGYHLLGRDVREDLFGWFGRLSAAELLALGCDAAAIVGVGITSWFVLRMVRRWRPSVEALVLRHVGRPANEETLRNWFRFSSVIPCRHSPGGGVGGRPSGWPRKPGRCHRGICAAGPLPFWSLPAS